MIIATPPAAVEEMLEEMAPHLGRGAAVTDVAAAKCVIHSAAADHLRSGVSFVGGHPMAGSAATFGIENADAELFQGTRWFVCTTPSASEASVRSVLGMIRELGAEPSFLNEEEHDYMMAAVSHLPLVVSDCALHDAARQRGLDGLRAGGRGHVQDDDVIQLRRPQHHDRDRDSPTASSYSTGWTGWCSS